MSGTGLQSICLYIYVCTFNRHRLSLLQNNSFTATAKAEFLQCVVIGSTEKKFYFLASDRRRHNVHIMTRIIHSAAPQPVKISTFYSPRCVLCNFFPPFFFSLARRFKLISRDSLNVFLSQRAAVGRTEIEKPACTLVKITDAMEIMIFFLTTRSSYTHTHTHTRTDTLYITPINL